MEESLINSYGLSVNKILSSSISLFLLRSLTAIFEISISFRIGCESFSEVFVKATIKAGKLFWEGYSDALITKGLLAFLISGLNELTPNEVVEIDKKFIEDTGLKASLTPSRSNGFLNILLKMQSQANEFL